MKTEDVVILALDGMHNNDACHLVEAIGNRVFAVKIHDLWDDQGPEVVERLKTYGAPRVWVDAKLHDIPETVRLRAEKIKKAGADIVTVHASGGIAMIETAVATGLSVYAVTVLTSLDVEDVRHIYGVDPAVVVRTFAMAASSVGVDGIVCSPKEVAAVRDVVSGSINLITPGVRSAGVSLDDQKRVDTPIAALTSGATRLVLGRQVTKAQDPVVALDALATEIAIL